MLGSRGMRFLLKPVMSKYITRRMGIFKVIHSFRGLLLLIVYFYYKDNNNNKPCG